MILVRNLRLAPEQPLDALRGPAAKKLRIPEREIKELKLVKRSLDARKKSDIHYVCAVAAALHGDEQKAIAHAKSADVSEYAEPVYDIPHVAAPEKRPVIVGFGPAGMFAALVLAKAGARPIVLERGMDAVSRKKAVESYGITFEPVKARYVKVLIKRTPALPKGHPGEGKIPFLFIDEIVVE